MTWLGPALDEDQRALAAMLDALAADRAVALDGDHGDTVNALVSDLADLGVWTLGTAVESGGGGADRLTTVVAFERLGRRWPALGWAAVQAHAGVELLTTDAGSTDSRTADLVAQLHIAQAAVAVVDSAAAHVHLEWQADRLVGSVGRIDAATESAHLLVLIGDDRALLVTPSALTRSPLRRTGLGGAFTASVEISARPDELIERTGDVGAVRARLWLGAAAVAAGISGAAVDSALQYAASRRQFGDALTAIPTVRESLLGQAARTAVTLTAAAAVAVDPVLAAVTVREAGDAAIDVAAAALQVFGGYGYLSEYGAERRLRDAVSLRAAVDTRGAGAAAARAFAGLAPTPALIKDAS